MSTYALPNPFDVSSAVALLDGVVFPDLDAVAGVGALGAIVGALLTVVLVVAVLMLVVCAIGWAVSSSAGNVGTATKARVGTWVSIGAAGLAGGGVAWLNFLLDVGRGL